MSVAGVPLPQTREERGNPVQAPRRERVCPNVCWWSSVLLVLGLVALSAAAARAHEFSSDSRPTPLREVAFDQRVNEQVPLDLALRDEEGKAMPLREYFGARPVIMVPVYYGCQNLCPLVLDGLVRSLRAISFSAGGQFAVVVVSFDPRDTPGIAAATKQKYLLQYGRPGGAAGWHFLTGEAAPIRQLTRAIGFRYTSDAATDQYAHATGIVIVTPQGRIFRYMYGIEFSPRDLRLSLVDASAHKVGSIIDQALLFCYRYDPATGKYSLIVMNVLRLAGLATVAALGTFVVVMGRREQRRAPETGERA